VTLAELKSWARIDDDSDDSTLSQLISAARQAAEEYLRRSLISQVWLLTLDLSGNDLARGLGDGIYDLPVTALYGDLPRRIDLPKGPPQSITSVVTYDLTNAASTYDPANYRLDRAGSRLILNFGAIWPAGVRPGAGCEITYVAGYGDQPSSVPQAIRTGILIHAASLYEQRGMCDDAMEIPPGAKKLYSPYRIMGRLDG
jgi:hypothetical protein